MDCGDTAILPLQFAAQEAWMSINRLQRTVKDKVLQIVTGQRPVAEPGRYAASDARSIRRAMAAIGNSGR